MDEHPNALVVRRLMAALSLQNRSEIEAVLAEECVWRVPGDNVLSGVYDGRRSILRLFGKMKRIFAGPASVDVISLAVSDSYAIVYQYGNVQVGDRVLRLRECLVYRIIGGRIVEVDEFQADMSLFDDAFSPESVAAAQAAKTP